MKQYFQIKAKVDTLREVADGIVLVGSAVYGNNDKESDYDFILVSKDLSSASRVLTGKNGNFPKGLEGFCVKEESRGILWSFHVFEKSVFEKMCQGRLRRVRFYREKVKPKYILKGFDGLQFNRKNNYQEMRDSLGGCLEIPVLCLHNNNMFIGPPCDKLLGPILILHDSDGHVNSCLKNLWNTVSQKLARISMKQFGRVDLRRMNISNVLIKFPEMPKLYQQMIRKRIKAQMRKFR